MVVRLEFKLDMFPYSDHDVKPMISPFQDLG